MLLRRIPCYIKLIIVNIYFKRLEAFWDSDYSWLYNDDEIHNPWYIDLGNTVLVFYFPAQLPGALDVGGPGYLGGANVVTIGRD